MSGRGNCDNLWKLWYAIFVFGGYAFLTYNAISQYQEFKRQAYDPRYGGTWIETPMDFYVAMKVVALGLLPIFLYSALLKVGNFANDGVMIGKDTENLKMVLLEDSRVPRSRSRAVWLRICRHFLPYTCYLHALSAFAFLLPLPTLHAEQIRNEAMPIYRVWHSDLDFLFRPDTTHRAEAPDGKEIYQESLGISPEMCNLMVALTILTIRLPNSFWFASRPFALLFSFKLLFASAHIIFNYCALTVLYKLSWNPAVMTNELAKAGGPIFVHGYNSCPSGFQMTIPAWVCILLESLSFLLIIASQVIIYEYGHHQFLGNLKKYRHYFSSITGVEGPDDLGFESNRKTSLCYRFWTNITSLVLLITLLCLKIPIICQFMNAFWCTHEKLFLVATVFSGLYLLAWMLLWFTLTVKTSWRFHVTVPVVSGHHGNQANQQNIVGPPEKLHGGDPVYGCFHEVGVPLSHSSNSSDNARRAGSVECCSESSKTSSGGGPRSQQENLMGSNYVFLQTTRSSSQHSLRSIPTISEHVDGTASDISYDTTQNRPLAAGGATASSQNNGGGGGTLLKYPPSRQGSLRGGPGPDDPYATLSSVISGNPQRFLMADGAGGSVMGSREDFNSLMRNARNRRGSRVTFKEQHDTIPGSPTLSHQSNVPSTDSGIGNCFHIVNGQPIYQPQQQFLVRTLDGRTTTANYEDYQMFGNLFNPAANYVATDSFGTPPGGIGVPTSLANYVLVNSSGEALQADQLSRGQGDYLKVPDILMTDQGMSASPNYTLDQYGGSHGSLSNIPLPPGITDESEMAMLPHPSDISINCGLSQSQDDLDQRMCSQV